MTIRKYALFFALSLFSVFPIYAQLANGMNYSIETAVEFSQGEYAPLWLTSNKYGLSSVSKNHGYLRAGIFRPYESKKFSYAFGLDLATAYNFTSSFVVQQAFIDLKYKIWELSVGSKERDSELKNQLLSSGGMTFSRNARPVPQVRISVPEYVIIPWTKGKFALKGHLAYGKFTDDNWQQDFIEPGNKYTRHALYHSKSLFGRIGNEDKHPLVFEGGFEMAAQFGGRSYNRGFEPYLDMPNKFSDFLKVIFALGSDATDGDSPNVYGNHVGSWHASFSYKFPEWKVRVYYEHFFEDHSMIVDEYAWKMYIDEGKDRSLWKWIPPLIPSTYYWKDGQYGLEVTFPKNRFISGLVYEYVATKEQSGPLFHTDTPEIPDPIPGRDNYYNHGIYTGWQHWGMGIGNPLVLSPIYNKDGQIIFKGNRTKSHHLGISGSPTHEVDYRVLLTHTRNWGTYSDPFVDIKRNVSVLLEASYQPRKLKGWKITGSFAFDRGDLMGDNTGGMITIIKTGLLTKPK